MPKKKISKRDSSQKTSKKLPEPKFSVGQLVQVNDGVLCADFDGLPLGGWVGKITKAGHYRGKAVYDLKWTRETLDAAHPIYETLAEEYNLHHDVYGGLREDELHLHQNGPTNLADPGDVSRFYERPLSPDTDRDRLRMVFGLKPLDPIPEADAELLQQYWQFLSKRLTFPFKAVYMQETEWSYRKKPFTCTQIDDPKNDGDDMHGLFCRGKRPDGSRLICPLRDVDPIGLPKDQQEILSDYCEWMC